MDAMQPSIAYALGGLAGNNAHGAGFLHYALNHKHYDLTPTMISCTSGQIYWLWKYLQARGSDPDCPPNPRGIHQQFMADVEALHRCDNINLDFATLAASGRQGVFHPAYDLYRPVLNDYTLDLWRNAIDAAARLLSDPFRAFWFKELLHIYPGRLLIPDFPDSLFRAISTTFNNECEIGIAFNSYNPKLGVEYVYLNPVALERLGRGSDKYGPGYVSNSRSFSADPADPKPNSTIYQLISEEAVRNGLWIYEYGFDQPAHGKATPEFVDGAYYRQIMLKELQTADIIFVARPINARWLSDNEGHAADHKAARNGHGRQRGRWSEPEAGAGSGQGSLPQSYVEIQDLKTEINFNGSYVGERAQIALINEIVHKRDCAVAAKGAPPVNAPFLNHLKHIDLVEVEIQAQRGFVDYLFESPKVFTAAGRALDEALARAPQVAAALPRR